MLQCVALLITAVSEELSASFIRFTRIGELGKTLAVTSNRRTLRRNTHLVFLHSCFWLIGRKSKLAVENKILIYKAIIIRLWTYGLELWGRASKSNTSIIQRSQSKILRMTVDAPWYVSNATLHTDLVTSSVQDVIQQRSNKNHNKIKTPENPLLKRLLARDDSRRRKRNWQLAWSNVPSFRHWTTPHHAIEIHNISL
jgi:hypothetical protein